MAKALLVGADVAMTTSALLRRGPGHVQALEEELRWMEEHGYESLAELRGSMSYDRADRPAAFERANYVRALHSWVTPEELSPTSPAG